MAVAQQFALPDQPTLGEVALTPLGGDGYTAPHSVYSIFGQVAHDATGGNAEVLVRFDPRYTQLISYILVGNTSGAGAIDYIVEIQCRSADRVSIFKQAPLLSVSGVSTTNQLLWTPPPIMCSAGPGAVGDTPFFHVITDNTDTETTILRARVYNFDKRARELMPIGSLLNALPRGTSAD